MTTGEVLTAAILSIAAIWLWSQVVGFFLTAAVAFARAFWLTRVQYRKFKRQVEALDDVKPHTDPAGNACTTDSCDIEMPPVYDNTGALKFKAAAEQAERFIREANALPPSAIRDPLDDLIREAGKIPDAINCRCSIPRRPRRVQLVERLALDVGEDEPVFCSWPAGHRTISLPARGGEPMILVRTDECILDDGTGRLAVVYREKPEQLNGR